MNNIDKQALRSTSDRDWFEDWFKREFHPDKTGPYIKDQLFFAVRAAREPLLDELEEKDKRLNEILTPNMLLPVIDDMDEDNLRHVIKTVCENYSLLHAKWEAAEKRIAELEAREVVLPQRLSMEGGAYCTAHARYDEEGDYFDRDEVIEAIRAAGIITKVGGVGIWLNLRKSS